MTQETLEKVVISITQFHAGTTHNIIPNEAYINGTVRTLSKEAQSLVVKRLQELCKGHGHGFGEQHVDEQAVPRKGTYNAVCPKIHLLDMATCRKHGDYDLGFGDRTGNV